MPLGVAMDYIEQMGPAADIDQERRRTARRECVNFLRYRTAVRHGENERRAAQEAAERRAAEEIERRARLEAEHRATRFDVAEYLAVVAQEAEAKAQHSSVSAQNAAHQAKVDLVAAKLATLCARDAAEYAADPDKLRRFHVSEAELAREAYTRDRARQMKEQQARVRAEDAAMREELRVLRERQAQVQAQARDAAMREDLRRQIQAQARRAELEEIEDPDNWDCVTAVDSDDQ